MTICDRLETLQNSAHLGLVLYFWAVEASRLQGLCGVYWQSQQNAAVWKYILCGKFLLENAAIRIKFSVFKIPILVFKTPASAQC